MKEILTLVDDDNKVIGKAERKKIHLEGLTHRGFVVLIKNSKNQVLLQRRSKSKDMAPNKWDVSLSGHPHPSENYQQAAKRRMREELKIDGDPKLLFIFKYSIKQPPFTDNEMCGFLECVSDDKPKVNKKEVSEIKFIPLNKLNQEIEKNESLFTPWAKMLFTSLTKLASEEK